MVGETCGKVRFEPEKEELWTVEVMMMMKMT